MNPCRKAVHLIFPLLLNLPANVKYLSISLSLIFLTGLSGFFTTQLHAQGVTVEVSTLPRVGVSISGPFGGGATEIVSNDLKRTGMISPVGGGSGDYLASGDAGESGVTGRLVNKKTGADVFSQTFTGKGRLAAHEFADARLARAIADYLGHERAAVERTIAHYEGHAPFRRGEGDAGGDERLGESFDADV